MVSPSQRLARRVNGSENAWTPANGGRNVAWSRMNHRWLILPLLAWPVVSAFAEHTWKPARELAGQLNLARLIPASAESSELRCRVGDDPRWAQQDWDDAAWDVTEFRNVPSDRGLVWLRFCVRDPTAPLPDALFLSLPYSYELYWDGVLIGRSGRPAATRAEEVPGHSLNTMSVSPELRAAGEHVIAIRASGFHNRYPGPTAPVQILPLPLGEWQQLNSRGAILPHAAMGAMLMVTITACVMWLLAARMAALLAFAALTLCTTVAQAVAMAFWDYGYSYEWNYAANLARGYAIDAGGLCLLALVIVMFALPRRCWFALVVLPVVGVVLGWFSTSLYRPLLTSAFALSLLATGWAAGRNRLGARVVFTGILITAAVWLYDPVHFVLSWYFQGFLPTLVGVTAAIALQVRAARRQAHEVQLMAARLELELLKKNLQPHFLLNTLATIVEVIEQEPKSAVTIIEALAREFRILARVSGEKLIPLAHELELCRAHLRIMSLRKGAQCVLDVVPDTDERLLVPPALFHTLVENGLTHLLPEDGWQRFELGATIERNRVRFTLVARGQPMADDRALTLLPLPATPAPFPPVKKREGTGLRYVKARLEESFPGRWSLQGEAVPQGWRTVVEIAGVERVPVEEVKKTYETADR